MRFIGRIFGIIVVIALYLLLWAMCKVSSLDERRRERMSRTWDEEKYK